MHPVTSTPAMVERVRFLGTIITSNYELSAVLLLAGGCRAIAFSITSETHLPDAGYARACV